MPRRSPPAPSESTTESVKSPARTRTSSSSTSNWMGTVRPPRTGGSAPSPEANSPSSIRPARTASSSSNRATTNCGGSCRSVCHGHCWQTSSHRRRGPLLGAFRARRARLACSARLLGSLMVETWRSDSSLHSTERQMIGAAHVDLLRAVLGATAERDTACSLQTDEALRVSAVRFIDSRLPFGRVPATEAARHVGVSVRTLHALFERAGTTFGAVVREHRVEACRRELADSRDDRSIGTIAAAWGFSDSAHLAKSFRSHFGCSPVEYRASMKTRELPQLVQR